MRGSLFALVGSVSLLMTTGQLIDRQAVVSQYNPIRNEASAEYTTPMQVGNGNFAFGMGTLNQG